MERQKLGVTVTQVTVIQTCVRMYAQKVTIPILMAAATGSLHVGCNSILNKPVLC
jgi:hypothetical protein